MARMGSFRVFGGVQVFGCFRESVGGDDVCCCGVSLSGVTGVQVEISGCVGYVTLSSD